MTFLCRLSFPHDECIGRKLTYEAKCQWLWRKNFTEPFSIIFIHGNLQRDWPKRQCQILFSVLSLLPLPHHRCVLKFLLLSTPEGVTGNANYQKVIKVYKQPLEMTKTTGQKVPCREWFGLLLFVERLRKPPDGKPDLWENPRAWLLVLEYFSVEKQCFSWCWNDLLSVKVSKLCFVEEPFLRFSMRF